MLRLGAALNCCSQLHKSSCIFKLRHLDHFVPRGALLHSFARQPVNFTGTILTGPLGYMGEVSPTQLDVSSQHPDTPCIHQHYQQQQGQQQQQPDHPQAQPQCQWTPQQERYMKLALEQARVALKKREVPIGCVVVRDDAVIATGFNMTNHTRNSSRHAELEAIDRILLDSEGDVSRAGFNRCQLYVTIEPCIMCAGALSLLGFQRVFFGASNDKFGGEGGAPHGRPFEAIGGLFAAEAIGLLQEFYIAGNPLAPKPHRPVMDHPPWEKPEDQQQQQKQQGQQQCMVTQ